MVGVTDADGIVRGKYTARDEFLPALDNGYGSCDVVPGWDSNGRLYDNVTSTGSHTAYSAQVFAPATPCRCSPPVKHAFALPALDFGCLRRGGESGRRCKSAACPTL